MFLGWLHVVLSLADFVALIHRRAKDLVQTNIGVLHKVADVLLEKEQIDGDEFQVRSNCTVPRTRLCTSRCGLWIWACEWVLQPVLPDVLPCVTM
jgi:hypothetical protein